MNLGSDLTGLFYPEPAGFPSFGIGVIVSFDPATGSNVVSFRGAALVNLAIIVGAYIDFNPGDVVALQGTPGGGWLILGHYRFPGAGFPSSPIPSPPIDTDSVSFTTTGFSLSTTYGNHGATSLTVPSWANHAQLMCTSCVTVRNNASDAPATHGIFLQTRIEGADSAETFVSIASGFIGGLAAAHQQEITVTPGQVIDFSARIKADVSLPADATANTATCTAIAIWTQI